MGVCFFQCVFHMMTKVMHQCCVCVCVFTFIMYIVYEANKAFSTRIQYDITIIREIPFVSIY